MQIMQSLFAHQILPRGHQFEIFALEKVKSVMSVMM